MPPERDPQSEIEKLERRYAEHPEGRMFAHLADAYRKIGELEQAERLIMEGLERHPDYLSAHIVLGRVYLDEGRLDEAQDRFKVVLEMDPGNLIALKALGDIALGAGAAEEARGWYGRMLQVDPYNEEAQSALQTLESGPAPGAPAAPGAATGPTDAAPTEPAPAEPDPAHEGAPDADPSGTIDSGPEEPVDPDRLLQDLEIAAEGAEHGPEAPAAPPAEADESGHGPGDASRTSEGGLGSGYRSPDPDRWDEIVPEAEQEPEELPWERTLDLAGGEPDASAEAPDAGAAESGEEPGGDDWAAELWGDAGSSAEGATDPDTPESTAAGPAASGAEAHAPDDAPGGGDEDRGSGDLELDIQGMDDWRPGLMPEGHEAAEPFDTDELLGDVRDREGGDGPMTETMADLYARQGLLEQALEIYRELAEVRPHDERLRAKIRDLEQELGASAAVEDALDAGIEEPMAALDPTEATGAPGGEAADETAAIGSADGPEDSRDMGDEADALGIADRDDGHAADEDLEADAARASGPESGAPGRSAWEPPEEAADRDGPAQAEQAPDAWEAPDAPSGDPIERDPGPAEPGVEPIGSDVAPGPSPDGDDVGFEFERAAPSADELADRDPFAASFEPLGPEAGPEDAGEAAQVEELAASPAGDREVEDAVARAEAELASMDELTESELVAEPVGAAAGSGSGHAEPEAGGAEDGGSESIGDYLLGLTGFTPGGTGSPSGAPGSERPIESAPPPASAPPSDEAAADDGSEDLEQFQEWLRSLKR